MNKPRCLLLVALTLFSVVRVGRTQNIDLVTLPKRDAVELTIYNSEDITLVTEVRAITFRKGPNRLQFSWANTLIDPSSVELRPLENTDQIEVLDTVYPGQKPQHLFWNVESEFEGEALVEVSYFTSGLTWRMDYVAITDPEERTLNFRGHVRVFNNSGEEYENAQVRLIVGKINLVERIAELAARRADASDEDKAKDLSSVRRSEIRRSFANGKKAAYGGKLGGQLAVAEKKIVKEGVSEYFMFSVEGSETIPNGWSKRMPAARADDVEFDIVYRMRDFQYGPRPVRFFEWLNDEDHELGDSPLPDGVVRLFRENGQDGLSYLGQQQIRYTPIDAKLEINLGADDLVVFERTKMRTSRSNFAFKNDRVVGWDEKQLWKGVIRNYHPRPIKMQVRLRWDGDVELNATSPATAFDYRTVELTLRTASRKITEFPYVTLIHHGRNAKQQRVKLRAPQPAPAPRD